MSQSRIMQGLVAIVGTGICSWHSGEQFEGRKLSRALVCQGAKVETDRCIPRLLRSSRQDMVVT